MEKLPTLLETTHTLTSEEVALLGKFRRNFQTLLKEINNALPDCRSKRLAIEYLEISSMFVGKAIAQIDALREEENIII